jgi:hypothetical protein
MPTVTRILGIDAVGIDAVGVASPAPLTAARRR